MQRTWTTCDLHKRCNQVVDEKGHAVHEPAPKSRFVPKPVKRRTQKQKAKKVASSLALIAGSGVGLHLGLRAVGL